LNDKDRSNERHERLEVELLLTCCGEETSALAENSGLGKMRSCSSAASDSPRTRALIPEILPAPEGSCDMDSTWRSLSEEAPTGWSPLAMPMAASGLSVAACDGDGDWRAGGLRRWGCSEIQAEAGAGGVSDCYRRSL
jgi:hypothetical protein